MLAIRTVEDVFGADWRAVEVEQLQITLTQGEFIDRKYVDYEQRVEMGRVLGRAIAAMIKRMHGHGGARALCTHCTLADFQQTFRDYEASKIGVVGLGPVTEKYIRAMLATEEDPSDEISFVEWMRRVDYADGTITSYAHYAGLYQGWLRTFSREPALDNLEEYGAYLRNILGYSDSAVKPHLSGIRVWLRWRHGQDPPEWMLNHLEYRESHHTPEPPALDAHKEVVDILQSIAEAVNLELALPSNRHLPGLRNILTLARSGLSILREAKEL